MYQTILFKAPGRHSNSPVVILQSVDLTGKSLTLGTRLARAIRRALAAVRPALTAENLNLAAGVGAFAGMLLALASGSAAGVYTCAAVGFSTIFIGMPLTEGSTSGKGGER